MRRPPDDAVTDMSRSPKLGFTAYQAMAGALFDLFASLRAEAIIP